MPRQPIIVEPSVEQVKSGKVSRPENVYVSTELAELPGDATIFLRSLWAIDYTDELLVFLEGILELDMITEPLRGPPDSHLRAARKVAAAAFGKKRFRGGVKIFEPYQDNVIYFVTMGNDPWMLPTRDDSLLWTGMKGDKEMVVEETPLVEYLAENPDLDKKEILQELQEHSTLLRAITKSLYIRKRAGESATRQLTNIEKAGFDISKFTGLFKEHIRRIRKISTQLENDSDI